MDKKAFALAPATIDELEGKVSGFAAIFGTVDSGGDRILPGAFTKTIAERFKKYGSIPLTWQHAVDDPLGPLGKVTVLREVDRSELSAKILQLAPDATGGLYYEGEITLTDVNKERMKHLVAGSVPGQSIGYTPVRQTFVKENGLNVRNLPEIKLFEIASVTIGMHDAALLTGVKSADSDATPATKAADIDTGTWDGPAEVAKADVSDLKAMCAVVEGDGSTKSDYHLPHHRAADGHPLVRAGVIAAAGALVGARGGYQGPDKDAARKHLAAHYHTLDLTPPWEDDAKHAAAPARKAVDLPISATGRHGAFDGRHTHRHAANGAADAAGGLHTHTHSHQDDGDHSVGEGHRHDAKHAQVPLWHKAASDSHDYIRARLQDALDARYPWQAGTYDYWGCPMMQPGSTGPGCCIWAVYDDRVVVNDQDFDAYWEIPYTMDGADNVTLGAPQLVKLVPQPVSMQNAEAVETMAADPPREQKAGRRNSRGDTAHLVTAHNALHSVLNLPAHSTNPDDAPGDPDADPGERKALVEALGMRLARARLWAATQERV